VTFLLQIKEEEDELKGLAYMMKFISHLCVEQKSKSLSANGRLVSIKDKWFIQQWNRSKLD